MGLPLYPSLYQLNTRAWLHDRSRQLGRPATLADVSDADLDRWAAAGFDWVWPLGVWRTGAAGWAVSREQAEWWDGYREALPEVGPDDVCGSPFAIVAYEVHPDFGGDAALATFRERLRSRGMRLLLDFVPNHVALDHPWLVSHPEYLVRGTEDDLAGAPRNFRRLATPSGPAVLAHGRDPYFPGWPDTLQLDYRNPDLQEAMCRELEGVADRCDGVRCDMAMLVLPDVFARTWGGPPPAPFWPEAAARVRRRHPDFVLMAEVYWDLEWVLQHQGFDYTYDKRLYDRLHSCNAGAVRGHLWADADYMRKSVRFLENHDESRAAAAFPPGVHEAAAVVTFLVPGLRFFHEGQMEGWRRRTSLHLRRRSEEMCDPALQGFYGRLLEVLRRPEVRGGRWLLLDCREAWQGNQTWERFLAFAWEGDADRRLLVTVNYGPTQGQCYVGLPWPELRGRNWVLRDVLGEARYERDGTDLESWGFYLDVGPWAWHVFAVEAA